MLNNKFFLKTLPIMMTACSLFVNIHDSNAAQRSTVSKPVTTRQPIANTAAINTTATSSATVDIPIIVEDLPVIDLTPTEISAPATIRDKSSQFAGAISKTTKSESETAASNYLADIIRQQRATLDAQGMTVDKKTSDKQEKSPAGTNACDSGLRKCMQKKCGNDFTGCALDGDTMFGDKINSCKKDLKCSGEEIKLFSTEIKADRDQNVRTSAYDKVIKCGDAYNDCMFTECTQQYNTVDVSLMDVPMLTTTTNKPNLDKCLSKSVADAAILKCKKIADQCREQDSGLAGRFGIVLAKSRETAEIDARKDEENLYALRDSMRSACERLGALFDERTFDCVYTVNFHVGTDTEHPMASRKRYAGQSFVCNQEWFGMDITTFKENAYRETRTQKASTSAMLGSGLGTAAALVTSGALDRAIKTQKAETEAQKECKKAGKVWLKDKCRTQKEAIEECEADGKSLGIDSKSGKYACIKNKQDNKEEQQNNSGDDNSAENQNKEEDKDSAPAADAPQENAAEEGDKPAEKASE